MTGAKGSHWAYLLPKLGRATRRAETQLLQPTPAAKIKPAIKPRKECPRKVPDETIREMRKVFEAGGFTVREISEKFDLTRDYTSKVLRYEVRTKAADGSYTL